MENSEGSSSFVSAVSMMGETPTRDDEQANNKSSDVSELLIVDDIGDYPKTDFEGGDRNIKTNLIQLQAYLKNPLIILTGNIVRIEPKIKEGEELRVLFLSCNHCQSDFRLRKIEEMSKPICCPLNNCGKIITRSPSFCLKFMISHGAGSSKALLLKKNADYFFGCTVNDFLNDEKLRRNMRKAVDDLIAEERPVTLCLKEIDCKQPYKYIIKNTHLSRSLINY